MHHHHTASIDIEIGKNLRRIRKQLKRSQTEIATILGITFQQIQKYENGRNRLSAGNLYILHKTLDIPLDDFFRNIALEPP